MSTKSFPIIFINMGGEMIYILEQRLTAQEIVTQKSTRVLNDIVGAMFNAKFIEQLFRPQELYPKLAIKHIFERLAHASIMRLNETSMDKLYDLMTMSVKYQMILCPCASDIIKITYNHVNSMRKFVQSPAVLDLLDRAFLEFNKHYEKLNDAEWSFIRNTILFYFQDVHIRVSIFLRDNLQTQNGQFILKTNGAVPTGFQPPGEIQTFKRGRLVTTHIFDAGEHHDPSDDKRLFQLGLNIYAKRQNSTRTVSTDNFNQRSPTMINASSDIEMINPDPKMIAQLNLLSDLIRSNSNKDLSRSSNFVKLSLFDDDNDYEIDESNFSYSQIASSKENRRKNEEISIDVSKRNQSSRLSNLAKDFDFGQDSMHSNEYGEDDDDLCAMMDRLPTTTNKRR